MSDAQVVQVIRTELRMRGNGRSTPLRRITEFWTLDGELLAEVDPVPDDPAAELVGVIQDVLELRGSDDGQLLVNNLQARDMLQRALARRAP